MRKRRYGRGKYGAHPDYVKYMEMIVAHKHYKGMPNSVSPDGHINWQVSSGKTTSFYTYYNERFVWWVNKADKLGIPGTGNFLDRFSITARKIHPTGYRPCRLCGKELNVGYFYLNHFLARRWNSLVNDNTFKIGQPIYEAIVILNEKLGDAKFKAEIESTFPERMPTFSSFGITRRSFELSNYLRTRWLTPGFMCNPPDRLDGFHDYGFCCRKTKDPGRSDENLRSYSHDRRTFMWWAEGDWNVADALATRAGGGKCENCSAEIAKISPDHIGPLSCGFKQIPFFRPLCPSCNSSKNRRMSANDVRLLISYEIEHSTSVASWQVRALWENWKHRVNTDSQAKQLGNVMRSIEDFYLRAIYELYKFGKVYFLVSLLSPQHAFHDVGFENLNPSTLTFDRIIKTKNLSLNRQSLAARIIRIAFEELLEYVAKDVQGRKLTKCFQGRSKVIIDRILAKALEFEYSDYDKQWDKLIKSNLVNEMKEKEILQLWSESSRAKPKCHEEIRKGMVDIFSEIGGTLPVF